MEDILKQADALISAHKLQECVDFLQTQFSAHPKSSELAGRLAQAYHDVAADKHGDEAAAKVPYEKCNELANLALTLDEKNYAAYKWIAISLSALCAYWGNKEKAESAFKIRDFAVKAIELCPNDVPTLHLLGQWCYGVANITWIQRKLASILFSTPPQSTFEEALAYFQKADELEPTFQRNIMFLGDTYVSLKQNDDARKCYERVMSLPATTVIEKEVHELVAKKLRKL